MSAGYNYALMAMVGLLLIGMMLMFSGSNAERPLLVVIGVSLVGVVMLGWVSAVVVLSLFVVRDAGLLGSRLLQLLYSVPKGRKETEKYSGKKSVLW